MIELKRCPFCGGEAKLLKIKITDEFYVRCTNGKCAVTPKTWIYKNKIKAIAAWNNRVYEEE